MLTIAILATGGVANADEVPFFGRSNVPDYVATMVGHETYSKAPDTFRTVKQHDGWTFVEEKRGDSTKSIYANFFKNVTSRAGREHGNEIIWFGVRFVEPKDDYSGIKAVIASKDEEAVAGEKCKWLELKRGAPQERKYGPIWMSCITEDGIEVANKVLFSDKKLMSEMRLTELKRMPVAEADVLPPKALFDVNFWLKPFANYPDHVVGEADFEAKQVGDRSEVRLLRHYPWYLRERRGNDGSLQLTIWNTQENQGLYYSSSKTERRLDFRRERLDPKRPWNRFDMATGKVNLGRTDTYLGQACTWFDLMPNVADAGRSQCLTSDGIPLKDIHTSGWGAGESFETNSLTRRAVDMQEIRPKQQYLDPMRWGFPVSNDR
ncbi:hypothetical protein [Rhizobium sp. Rhizsp42]|uniref:hypothetical protein n=1 Tax=Rhizobium sp. Rhizsp42 TaxID=3243034 RepID=UPI0039AFABF6